MGDLAPTWEQLLTGVGTVPATRTLGSPRHAAWSGSQLVDDAMSWREATAWSAVAVSCALVASRWAAHLLP
jgi:hypothetical protein